ncbi:MAG: hypothetical protein RL398_722 [Planctomycetota bacterium]
MRTARAWAGSASGLAGAWIAVLATLLPSIVGPLARAQDRPPPARAAVLPDAAALLAAATWEVREVGLGLELRRAWLAKLGPGPQSLCVLLLDPALGADTTVAVPRGLRPTTVQARDAEAIIAWNGGFFLPNGRPRGLRRGGGVELSPAGETAVATVGWRGAEWRFGTSRDDWSEFPEVVEAGPRLLADGGVVDHGAKQRSIRHPRTALGVRADGVVVVLTADGRTPLAAGLSLEELAEVMQALGCRDAINLDGGGSTTLWAAALEDRDAGRSGIANRPCDNKRYDERGERAVADVVLVHGRRTVVVDDDELEIAQGRLRRDDDGTGQLGRTFATAPSGETVLAAFRLRVPSAGRYAIQRRSVLAPGLVDAAASWAGGNAVSSDAPGGWYTVAERPLAAGEFVVEVASVPGRPLAVDAVRLLSLD